MSIFSLTDILNSVFNKDAKKLKVETDVQISSVTATDVTVHDAVTMDNKLKVNEDGSVPVELKGSLVAVPTDLQYHNIADEQPIPTKDIDLRAKIDTLNIRTTTLIEKVALSNRIQTYREKATATTWKQVQDIVRGGIAEAVYSVGDQFTSTFGTETITWDVIGINHDTPTDKDFQYSMTLQTHDCIAAGMADAPEPTNTNVDRQTDGNNRYIHSAIRQWLNSDEAVFAWVPQHEYDAAPTGTLYDGAGFLNLLEPELVAVLGAVDKYIADGGGEKLITDKVNLLSPIEALAAKVYGVPLTTGDKVYPWYEALASAPTQDVVIGRIKQFSGANKSWWLNAPHTGFPGRIWGVGLDGKIYAYKANSPNLGIAPIICIV